MSAEPTTRARDLQRARKLLAIAKSPNDNEARTAAVMAARIIALHGFEVVDRKAAAPTPTSADFFSVDRADRDDAADFANFVNYYTRPQPPAPQPSALEHRALGRDEIRTCRTCGRRVTDGGIWFSLPSFDVRGWCEQCGPRHGPRRGRVT